MSKKPIKRVALFGGTGLIGRALQNSLISNGYYVGVFSRNSRRSDKEMKSRLEYFLFDNSIQSNLENFDIVINLAGENISKRWTKNTRKRILVSRVSTAEKIVRALNNLERKPELYIQASAIGYYPFSMEDEFTEVSAKGDSFLSNVVDQWERSSELLDKQIRKVIIRTGVVLTKKGGMLPKTVLPIRFCLGGIPGNGNNWISWIQIDDLTEVVGSLIRNKNANGIYNLSSPEPVRMGEFINYCGVILKRPVFFRIPRFLIRTIFGQMGVETILSSQKVIPERLLSGGFVFQYRSYKEVIEKELK